MIFAAVMYWIEIQRIFLGWGTGDYTRGRRHIALFGSLLL